MHPGWKCWMRTASIKVYWTPNVTEIENELIRLAATALVSAAHEAIEDNNQDENTADLQTTENMTAASGTEVNAGEGAVSTEGPNPNIIESGEVKED